MIFLQCKLRRKYEEIKKMDDKRDGIIKIIIALISAIASIIVAFIGGGAFRENSINTDVQNEMENAGIEINIDNNISDIILGLNSEKNEWQEKYYGLNESYTSLESSYTALESDKKKLESQYDELESQCAELKKNVENQSEKSNTKETGESSSVAKDWISLTTLTPINSHFWYINSESMEDSLGMDYSEYKSYIAARIHDGSGTYGEYYINNQYTTLNGTIAAHSSADEDFNTSVTIYGDDQPIKVFSDINRKTERFSFSIDISDVKFLKIQADREGGYGGVLLTDWTLIP